MFYACSKLRYYLFAKRFTMMTDHNNLLWMESSEVPKIVRMRIFLQEFNYDLIHIPGKSNVFADWLSRMHDVPDTTSMESMSILQLLAEVDNVPVLEDNITALLTGGHTDNEAFEFN